MPQPPTFSPDRRLTGNQGLAALWLAASVLLGGCAGGPPPGAAAPPADPTAAAIQRAEAAERPAEAAGHYFDALQAARRRGDAAATRTLLDRLTRAEAGEPPLLAALPPPLRFEVQALALDRTLAAGDPSPAAGLMARLAPQNAAQERRAAVLRARALAVGGDRAGAALALMRTLDGAASAAGAAELGELAAEIWRQLSLLPLPALARLAVGSEQAGADAPSTAGWLELARNYNAALSAARQRSIWQRWREAHPRHPAARFVPPSLRDHIAPPVPEAHWNDGPLARIALLVPLSGDYAAAAEAVRDGFVAAYLHALGAGPLNQEVRVYDTGADGAAAAYRRAVGEGASAIVGPLRKEAVAELRALSPTVPVVALNRLDAEPGPAGAAMLQLALAVEDEATAIAKALQRTGVARIALFDSPGAWWERARRRFEDELDTAQVVAAARLGGLGTITAIAGEVLGIDASGTRHKTLSALLGAEPEFTPRRRMDIDAVVAFVDGTQLMALKPALDFHFASDLPVYVSSRAVRGVAWRRLEGVRVCDIPWRLHPQPLRRAAAGFAASRGSAADLFALGIDGFRVVNQLTRLVEHGEGIAGSTGVLRAGAGGRILRTPAWGRVERGKLLATLSP